MFPCRVLHRLMRDFHQFIAEMAAPTPEPMVQQVLLLADGSRSLKAIAAAVGIHSDTVKAILKKHGIYPDDDASTSNFLTPPTHNRMGKELLSNEKKASIIKAGTVDFLNDLEIMKKFGVGRSTVRRLLAPHLNDTINLKRAEHNKQVMRRAGHAGAGIKGGYLT